MSNTTTNTNNNNTNKDDDLLEHAVHHISPGHHAGNHPVCPNLQKIQSSNADQLDTFYSEKNILTIFFTVSFTGTGDWEQMWTQYIFNMNRLVNWWLAKTQLEKPWLRTEVESLYTFEENWNKMYSVENLWCLVLPVSFTALGNHLKRTFSLSNLFLFLPPGGEDETQLTLLSLNFLPRPLPSECRPVARLATPLPVN